MSLFFLLLKTAALVTFCVGVSKGADYVWTEVVMKVEEAKALAMERLTVTKVITHVKEVDDATLDDIIASVSKEYGIDPLVMQVLADKESDGGKALYRFEPKVYAKLQAMPKHAKKSDDELRMLASSHGVFHVLGDTAARECDIHWARLYDVPTTARCAASIVARLTREAGGVKDPGQRLWTVFYGFNGSGPMAEAYADDAMRRVGSRLYAKLVR